MILTDVCSVDVTAFELGVNVTSPISKAFEFGADRIGSAARTGNRKFPRAGADFPFDWIVAGEPAEDPRPLELNVKVHGLVFRDGTAAGDSSWVKEVQERRKRDVQDFVTERELLTQIAHLQDAKAILKGDPDPSLNGSVRRFWLECKSSLSNDPAGWAASIENRAYWIQSLTEAMSQHPELTMEDK
jgi:hypothetical protein